MAGKLYICRECGYAFPKELTHLIEQKIQVFCERCGSPFILEGVEFKSAPTPIRRRDLPSITMSEKSTSNLGKAIQVFNNISFIPILIFTIISFAMISGMVLDWGNWISILVNRSLLGIIGLILLIYDRTRITSKIKEQKYNEIIVDSFCYGILGCILFGTGVLILIKGILIVVYVLTDKQNKDMKAYDYGILTKNSLNYFSSKAGFIIILFGIFAVVSGRIPDVSSSMIINFPLGIGVRLVYIIFGALLLHSFVALLIDRKIQKKLKDKNYFKLRDAIKVIILGVWGTLFFAAGIFIILKGVLIFFLFTFKPSEKAQITTIEEKIPPSLEIAAKVEPPEEKVSEEEISEVVVEPQPLVVEPEEEEPVIRQPEIPDQKDTEIKIKDIPVKEEEEKREDQIEKIEEAVDLRLHDSLLPVKDEKDKKLVKQYFTKIFEVLSKDLRQKILDLKIPKKDKRELLEELAFLTKEEQAKYVEALVDLYKEIPGKLIERIRKLPNVEPKYFDRIAEQLKFMNSADQIKFVQFLEDNA